MKRIKIIEMGGTISAQGKHRLDFKNYESGIYGGSDFLGTIPELEKIASITFEPFLNITSTGIEPKHWLTLRNRVIETLEEEHFDGVVLMHGTNTIEETAYFLHLTVPSEKPIIMTGSQKPFTALGTDAFPNLLAAVRTAANPNAYGKGVLVVLNEEISGAREVTKTNTYRQETFQSGQFGFLGFIDPDHNVVFYQEPTRRHTIASEFAHVNYSELPNVEIVYSYAGTDGKLIQLLNQSGHIAGIITAGTGAGLVSPEEYAALKESISKGIIIARSSRVGNGRVLPIDKYDGDGFLTCDNLLPQKARILLMLGLTTYTKHENLQRLFQLY